ncbi:MAG: hypothetical protein R3C49_14130 [Planctomycetaceae bacterium]
MSEKSNIIATAPFTVLCSAGVVAFETPQNLLVFVIWAISIALKLRHDRNRQSPARTLGNAVILLTLMFAVIAAAALAPIKRIDAVCEQTIQLPRLSMTASELSEYCLLHRDRMPLRIHLPQGGLAKAETITFSSVNLSLRQFIAEVEQQTGCHHRFSGCGNAYSILYGSAYNFGLSFSPDANSGYRWE